MKGVLSWHLETFRAHWLPLCSARQEQHLRQHVWNRQVAQQKNSCKGSGLLRSLKKMVIGTWHMNWFLALLGRPSLSIFSLPAQNEYFLLMDHKDFYLYHVEHDATYHVEHDATYVFLDFHVALPKRPDPGNTSTTGKSTANMLVVLVPLVHGCQPVQTRRNQVSTHITFAI